jgi:phosphinothricin acetyltransferase
MIVRDAASADVPAIVEILNEAIARTNAMFRDTPVEAQERAALIAERQRAGFAQLVATVEGGVAGYGGLGPFRPFEGFRTTAEHSIYVREAARGRGLGALLLDALEARARAMGLHAMVGGVAHDNAASIALHARRGFVEVGRMPEIAVKGGRWQTLVLMQKLL